MMEGRNFITGEVMAKCVETKQTAKHSSCLFLLSLQEVHRLVCFSVTFNDYHFFTSCSHPFDRNLGAAARIDIDSLSFNLLKADILKDIGVVSSLLPYLAA